MVAGAEAIARVLGASSRALYRAPYGHFVPETVAEARRRGWTCVFWSALGHDWEEDATPRSVADARARRPDAGRDRPAARRAPRQADGPRAGDGRDRDPAGRDRAARVASGSRQRDAVSMMDRPRILLVPNLTEIEWHESGRIEEWAEVASYDAPGVGDEPPASPTSARRQSARRGLEELERRGWDRCFVVGRRVRRRGRRAYCGDRAGRRTGMALGHARLSNATDGDRAPLNREVYAGCTSLIRTMPRAFIRQLFRMTGGETMEGGYSEKMVDEYRRRVPVELMLPFWDSRARGRQIGDALERSTSRCSWRSTRAACCSRTRDSRTRSSALPHARAVRSTRSPARALSSLGCSRHSASSASRSKPRSSVARPDPAAEEVVEHVVVLDAEGLLEPEALVPREVALRRLERARGASAIWRATARLVEHAARLTTRSATPPRLDPPAGQAQVSRDAVADEPAKRGEERRRAELDLGVAEDRLGRGDPQVAERREVEAPAERVPVDGRDRRLRERPDWPVVADRAVRSCARAPGPGTRRGRSPPRKPAARR